MNLDLLQNAGAALSLIDLSVALVLSFLIGLGMAGVYRSTWSGFTYERSFLLTLATMPPIVALVMTFIANNLALSLGMVGALSIIRFRTVIKDSRDMVFLFWTIAVGLGCGTGNWLATVIASLFLAAVLLLLRYLDFGRARRSDYVLVVRGDSDSSLDAARGTVGEAVPAVQLRSLEHDENGWELVFELRLDDDEAPIGLPWLRELRATSGVDRVSLLAPQLSLPV